MTVVLEETCEYPGCDTTVRYGDYVPHHFLCIDCGFPDPAPRIEADENGMAVVPKAPAEE